MKYLVWFSLAIFRWKAPKQKSTTTSVASLVKLINCSITLVVSAWYTYCVPAGFPAPSVVLTKCPPRPALIAAAARKSETEVTHTQKQVATV